jgi:signal transduction histidine kinase
LRVPPDYSRLEFRFTALSLTAPLRNRYRFRLAGFENTWEEAGTRRTAYYKRVPPGHYQFRVAACNNDGVWNNEGASLDVIIIPPWWETSGFRWAAAAAMGLAIYGAYHWRVKSLTMRTAAQQEFSRRLIESQEQERQRIAGELHDGLGQSLLVIKSRALLALKDPDLPGPVKDELDSLTNMAGNAIGEARQIAHNLRPVQLDELGLTRTIRGMITNVSRAAGIPIEHELANLDGAFAQDQEITVYRIVQELLNNVMKHARASQARVTLERDAGWVRLSVHDNGRGFNPEISGKGGLGMRTISERVRILTGTWSVQSPPGGGTTVLVDLPIDKSRSKTGTPP